MSQSCSGIHSVHPFIFLINFIVFSLTLLTKQLKSMQLKIFYYIKQPINIKTYYLNEDLIYSICLLVIMAHRMTAMKLRNFNCKIFWLISKLFKCFFFIKIMEKVILNTNFSGEPQINFYFFYFKQRIVLQFLLGAFLYYAALFQGRGCHPPNSRKIKNFEIQTVDILHGCSKRIQNADLFDQLYYKYQTVNHMPKRFIKFNLAQDQEKKSLFLRDTKYDFIVILEKKIFQLHKQLLTPSQFFQELIVQDKKSVTINSHLNVDCFQKILGCFYGIQASFERHNIVIYLLDILQLLKVKELNNQLKNDMKINFEQYGLFNLFYLSRRMGLKDLQQKCIKQLIDEQFQQINYNKYDLFQLSPQLFIFVLKEHERLRAEGQIEGLDSNQIRGVCQEYCKTNSATINVQQILKYGDQFSKLSKKSVNCHSGSQDEHQPVTRRRNATWTSLPEKESKSKKVKTQENPNFLSQNKIYTFQEKSNQVMKIRLINSNMQQNNHKLAAEIRTVKSSIDQKEKEEYPHAMDDLDKRLRQFQQKSKNAHKKMEDLKKKMMQLNLDQDGQTDLKAINNQNEPLPSFEKNQKKESKILSQMVVLKKTQDIGSDQSDQY